MRQRRHQHSHTHLAEEAVGLAAEFTVELVDFILKDTPASTVMGLAVEAVLTPSLSDAQTQLQELLVLLWGEKLYSQGGTNQGHVYRIKLKG